MNLTEQEKQTEVMAIEKKYGKRKNFEYLKNRAHREIFADDILQPGQRDFKHIHKRAAQKIEQLNREVEYKAILSQEEVEEVYRKNVQNVLTNEQITLKGLQSDHPTMVDEEDILRCQTR